MDMGTVSSILIMIAIVWWSWVIHCAHKADILKSRAEIAKADELLVEQQLAEMRSELESLTVIRASLEYQLVQSNRRSSG